MEVVYYIHALPINKNVASLNPVPVNIYQLNETVSRMEYSLTMRYRVLLELRP